MMKKILIFLPVLLAAIAMQSCLKSDVDDYEDWRAVNDAYINKIETEDYEKISPSWAPYHSVYMKWHTSREATKDNLVPLSTSTVDVKYELYDLDGTLYQTSYKTNGDSIFNTVVNQTVVGFQIGLTNMHVGDSVTLVIPYSAGYGNQVHGNVKPYTNLVYKLKLVSIPALEKPNE